MSTYPGKIALQTSGIGSRPEPARSTFVAQELSAVSAEELAFAISVFVGAASGHLFASDPAVPSGAAAPAECVEAYKSLSRNAPESPPSDGQPQPSLFKAFTALWDNYASHDLQYAICARVLGFYYLMERSKGRAIEGWMEASPEDPETVVLSPSVVEALSIVPLDGNGQLPEHAFLEAIKFVSNA